ncbi:MAG: GGDEF domain-containing protein [Lachnospiraceae bacterium]|nr:GGDEF domain-containing protein [Lachnospiraceae bacterium]
MLERIKNYILYADTDKESYLQVQSSIEKSNQLISMVFSSVAFVLIAIMFLLSCFIKEFSSSRMVYLWGTIFSASLFIISILAKKYTKLTYLGVYLAISGFMLYGIAIGTITRPEEQTVTFMVMLLLLPLIFVDKPIRVAVCIIFYVAIFIALVILKKSPEMQAVDISDAIIFGLLAIASGSIVIRVKVKGYVLEKRLQIMSETDQLTGLNNRNCYEWKLETYPSVCKKSLCCVYIDANGLHELNNTKGHKAGDEMLQYIANSVKNLFGAKDSYRIGGDEFVAFAVDASNDDLEGKISELTERINEQGYHAALGYEIMDAKSLEINKLIVSAESKMYKDKSDFYKTHDRRKR